MAGEETPTGKRAEGKLHKNPRIINHSPKVTAQKDNAIDLTKEDEKTLSNSHAASIYRQETIPLPTAEAILAEAASTSKQSHTTNARLPTNKHHMPGHLFIRPARCQPNFGKPSTVYTELKSTQKAPENRNIGVRILPMPKISVAENGKIVHQSPLLQGVPSLATQPRRYATQTKKGGDRRPTNTPNSLHQHLLEHPTEQGVLGAIFINHLLQQSVIDYQKFRSGAYPHLAHTCLMRQGARVASINQPVMPSPNITHSCHEMCQGRRNPAKVISTGSQEGKPTNTMTVSSTFTSPSASSVLTMAKTDDSRGVSAKPREHGIAPNIPTNYSTVEMKNCEPFHPIVSTVSKKQPKTDTANTRSGSNKEASENTSTASADISGSTAKSTSDTQFQVVTFSANEKTAESTQQPKERSHIETLTQTTRMTSRTTMKTRRSSDGVQTRQLRSFPINNFPEVVAEVMNMKKGAFRDPPAISSVATIRPTPQKAIATTRPCSQPTQKALATTRPSEIPSSQPTQGHPGVFMPSGTWQFTFKANTSTPTSKATKRVVTFADVPEQVRDAKIQKCHHHWRRASGSHHTRRPRLADPRRVLRSALRPTIKAMSETPVTTKRSAPRVRFRASPSQIATAETAGTAEVVTAPRPVPTLPSPPAVSPPPATVTLQHACRFYRCQSVTHPNAVLGMIRMCQMCCGNYTIACGNVASGVCTINLNEVECPRCWNSNACYCGQPFSDRYIGGREIV